MRRVIYAFLLIFISFLLQTTVFRALNFGGISPNLMIIVTAAIGFMRNEKSGLLVGFFSGLLIDIFYGDIIGFYALVFMLTGYLNGIFSRIFYPQDMKLPLSLIALSDLTYGGLCYIFLYLLNGKFIFGYFVMHVMIPEMVYTVLISILFYPLILMLYHHLDELDRRANNVV
ncbi:MAG: rod shape-determining protein MreD [Lachnospiraceae bacterium]|nr:rod shape-determining protein MreD [Lachnospiraceae bacterium]